MPGLISTVILFGILHSEKYKKKKCIKMTLLNVTVESKLKLAENFRLRLLNNQESQYCQGQPFQSHSDNPLIVPQRDQSLVRSKDKINSTNFDTICGFFFFFSLLQRHCHC